MVNLAIRVALRDWRKIILIALVLTFAGSMFVYYQSVMFEMRYYSANEYINQQEEESLEDLQIPRTKVEQLVAAMALMVILAAGFFQLNMLVVDMVNKRSEHYAMEVIGVSQEHIELFPLVFSIIVFLTSSALMVLIWKGLFGFFKDLVRISYVSTGLLIIVIIIFGAMSILIGVRSRDIATFMHE